MLTEQHIEHLLVKPASQLSEIQILCNEAVEFKFPSICILPLFVPKAKSFISDIDTIVVSVIGYPFGHHAIEAKVAESVLSILEGADELEIVVNTSAIKNNDWQYLANEITTILPIIRNKNKSVTVILETGLLNNDEIIKACDLYGAAGIDFIKIGTGFFQEQNLPQRIKLIRSHLADTIKIKACREIINFNFANELIEAGANKLSCSNGISLLHQSLQYN